MGPEDAMDLAVTPAAADRLMFDLDEKAKATRRADVAVKAATMDDMVYSFIWCEEVVEKRMMGDGKAKQSMVMWLTDPMMRCERRSGSKKVDITHHLHVESFCLPP